MPAMKGKVRNYIHPDNDIYTMFTEHLQKQSLADIPPNR